MYSECRECSGKKLNIADEYEEQECEWFEWTTKTHEFEKSGERKVTKKTVKVKRTGSVTALINQVQDDLLKFKEQYFNMYITNTKNIKKPLKKCMTMKPLYTVTFRKIMVVRWLKKYKPCTLVHQNNK